MDSRRCRFAARILPVVSSSAMESGQLSNNVRNRTSLSLSTSFGMNSLGDIEINAHQSQWKAAVVAKQQTV